MSNDQDVTIYDIDSYTDGELLTVLDLSNPTDRELEAKIIMMIRKYEGTDARLFRFFNEIYEHFFEIDEYESEMYEDNEDNEENEENENQDFEEGFSNMESGKIIEMDDEDLKKDGWAKKWSDEKKKYYYINTNVSPAKIQWTKPKTSVVNSDAAYNENKIAKKDNKDSNPEGIPQAFNDTNTQTTRAIDYPSGWLNPLIKETFKRVLYLDSQYRNMTYYPNSCAYSINLSDTLLGVLTIKLHSATIPYSWYTIPNNPRANQFVLKGVAPGINNANRDIIIKIPPGNYISAVELVNRVNAYITTDLPKIYPDVSFNDTRIEYDNTTLLANLYINIKSTYTTSKLVFPSFDETVNYDRNFSNIPAFLGFHNSEYKSTLIKSNLHYNSPELLNSDIFNVYTSGPNKNNYFTIFNVLNSSTTEQIVVHLNFPSSPFDTNDENYSRQYTREALINHLHRALKNHEKLSDESFIELTTLENGSYMYRLNVVLNRNTTNPGNQYVVFPKEDFHSPIWCGAVSCFMFDEEYTKAVNEQEPVHHIYSESSPCEMRYIVFTRPYIILNCITNANYSYRINIPNSTTEGYTKREYIDAINNSVKEQAAGFDISLNFILHEDDSSFLHVSIMIYKRLDETTVLTELDYQVELYDEDGVYTDEDGMELSSWNYYMGFSNFAYILNHPICNVVDADYCEIWAENPMRDVEIAVTDENSTFYIEQDGMNIPVTIPCGVYTKSVLYKSINESFAENPETQDAFISSTVKNGELKTLIKLAASTTYTTKDYQLIFFDVLTMGSCEKVNKKAVVNTTWDQVLGWMLGFREKYVYEMKPNSGANTFKLTGNTAVTTNSVNYALIVMDDYTQNHLNDGIVTMTKADKNIPLPSYANRAVNRCDPVTGKSVPAFKNTSTNGNLTRNQVYSAQQITQNAQNKFQYYADPPSVKDMFSVLPLKLPNNHGDNIITDGGTLQDNTRIYFGPVNIRRVNIQLLNERGRPIDLNGRDWSFTMVVECQYTANKDEQGKLKKAIDKK